MKSIAAGGFGLLGLSLDADHEVCGICGGAVTELTSRKTSSKVKVIHGEMCLGGGRVKNGRASRGQLRWAKSDGPEGRASQSVACLRCGW